jgi:hypothetical protein
MSNMSTAAPTTPCPIIPAAGCDVIHLTIWGAPCWVEYEIEPESGDGWDEPHMPEEVIIMGVVINGVLCNGADVPDDVVDGWVERITAARRRGKAEGRLTFAEAA